MAKDSFGREIDYLRVSVIDHCNLRCVYCMPIRDLTFTPSFALLSAEEIEQVVQAAADVGFRKVRITGGEPTLRADIVEIVRRVAAISGIADVTMTTNGVLLPPMAEALAEAGLRRVNLHIDTLDPENFKRTMRFGAVEDAWAGVEAAVRAGLTPIKINAVVTRDYNHEDVVELARLTLQNAWHVRFIELMPLGGGSCARLALGNFVPTSETRERIEAALGTLTPLPNASPSDESVNFKLPDARGVVGFISPVSEPYCGDCNRMRLTADGKLHLCLLHDDELDIKPALRNGGDMAELRKLLEQAVATKPTGHNLDEGVSTQMRNMFQIGG